MGVLEKLVKGRRMTGVIALLLVLAVCMGLAACESTQTVEINNDNWRNFFELRTVETWEEDSFGEPSRLQTAWVLYLREEYLEKVDPETMDIAIGYTAFHFSQYVEADFANQKVTWGGLTREDEQIDEYSNTMQLGGFLEEPETGRIGRIEAYSVESNSVYTTTDAKSEERTATWNMLLRIDRVQGTMDVKGDLLELEPSELPNAEIPEYIPPVFETAHLIGLWQENPEGETILLNEDGTCTIYGTDGEWKVFQEYNGGDQGILVTANGQEIYNIDYYIRDDGSSYLDLYQKNGDGWDYVESDFKNVTTYQTVELTKDNFWEYFEIVQTERYNKDDFGDPTGLSLSWYMVLKDEYFQILDTQYSEVIVEIYSNQAVKVKVNLDLENEFYEITSTEEYEYDSWKEHTTRETADTRTLAEERETYGIYFYGDYVTPDYLYFKQFPANTSGYEILRLKGSLTFTQ